MGLTRDFSLHWKNYLILFLVIDLSMELVLIPLFNAGTSLLMSLGSIPYVSYTNALSLLTKHPFVTLGLLGELLVLILCVFSQFALVLNGIVRIRQDRFSFKAIIKDTQSQLRTLDPLGVLFFAGYFLLIVPFSGIFFKTPLLSKVVIPEFIIEFLLQKPLYAIAILSFYLVIFVLSIRLLFLLPLMLFKKLPIKKAIRESLELTKGKFVFYLFKLVKITLVAVFLNIVLLLTLYLGQLWLDEQNPFLALSGGIVNLTLLQLGSLLISIWASITALKLTLPTEIELPSYADPAKKSLLSRLAKPMLILFGIVTLGGNVFYLVEVSKTPLIISHRGVNDENGVQNTIPALKKTASSKPNYIEIDVQETKDHKFVVMHDENLSQLADLDVSPQELTLAQLTAITVHENGHKAKIPSFDEYLKVAQEYDQKLLVEIKTTKRDSDQMLKNFFAEYGDLLVKRKHQLQSLDYEVITSAKKYTPKLSSFYILPYNFIFPQTPANGYTMEKTTLNDTFVTQAHLSFKQVYSWTVNDTDDFKNAAFLNADGIITDNVTEAKEFYRDFTQDASYAQRLLDYTLLLPD